MFQSFTVEVYAMSGKGDPQQGRGGFEPFGGLRIVQRGSKRRSERSEGGREGVNTSETLSSAPRGLKIDFRKLGGFRSVQV